MSRKSSKLALFAALVVLWAVLPNLPLPDFRRIWVSCLLLRHHLNPYSLPVPEYLRAAYAPEVTEDFGRTYPFFWIPLWLSPFFPFGFFSLFTARRLFILVKLLLLGWGIDVCAKLFPSIGESKRRPRFESLALMSAFPAGVLLSSFWWGSPSWIILIGLIGIHRYLGEEKRAFLVGFFLYLLGIKIQITAPLMGAVAVWSLRNRGISILSSFFFVMLLGTGTLLPFQPDLFLLFWEVIQERRGEIVQIVTASLPGILRESAPAALGLYISFVPITILCLIGLVGGAFLDLKRLLVLLYVLAPFCVLLAPYSWGHDSVILLPSVYWALESLSDFWARRNVLDKVLLLLFVAIPSLVTTTLSIRFWVPHSSYVIYPLSISLLVYFALRRTNFKRFSEPFS